MRRFIPLLALPLLVAACGGDDEKAAPSGSSASTVNLTAQEKGDEEFGFSPGSLTAKAGKVTIQLTLPKGLKAPHGIAIDGQGKPGEVVQAGGTSEVTANLKPGTYTYYCPVSDHREEGMEGKLTVS